MVGKYLRKRRNNFKKKENHENFSVHSVYNCKMLFSLNEHTNRVQGKWLSDFKTDFNEIP